MKMMFASITALLIGGLILTAYPILARQTLQEVVPLPSVDQVKKKAALAIGNPQTSGSWNFRGITYHRGLWQTFAMAADTHFRYRMDVQGPLHQSSGFDGKIAWKLGVSGVSHPAILADSEIPRIVASVMTGSWTSPNAPFKFKVLSSDLEATRLEMTCQGGRVPVTLFLNPNTGLVDRLTYWGPDGDQVWTFRGFRSESGITVPTRIDYASGGYAESIVIQTVHFDHSQTISYSMPRSDSSDFQFAPKVNPQVSMIYIHGHLFVRPMLDGADEGWFIFDTGAGVMVIDSQIAAKHNAPTIGDELTVGVTQSSDLKICQGISFQLGPVTLNHPTYMEGDMSALSKAFDMPIAGICGYDFISRAAIAIDVKSETMEFYPSGKVSLPHGIRWIPLEFDEETPSTMCQFEGDRTGIFAIDTGSNSAVDFLAPTVEKYGLLQDRALTSTSGGSPGGPGEESKDGKVAWFEFAGRRYENLPVGFQLTKHGTFASPFFDGNIGMKLMNKARVIFDYQQSRMAAIPYPPNPKQ